MAIRAEVFRWTLGDCTNGGVTSRVNAVVLLGETEPVPTRTAPVVYLRLVRRWAGTPREYLHAEPIEQPKDCVGPMMGGNFIYSSDSHFPSRYPIPVHDRFETPEQYEKLTR